MTTTSSSRDTWVGSSPSTYDSIVHDNVSVDNGHVNGVDDVEVGTTAHGGIMRAMSSRMSNSKKNELQFRSIRVTLSCEDYDAATIRAEFQTYHSLLPKPDQLLQKQHSVDMLVEMIARCQNKTEMPRFLKPMEEGGIAPHHALCCLLLDDFCAAKEQKSSWEDVISSCLVRGLSFGCLYPQLILPADFIRDQFYRIAHVVPSEMVEPHVLRLGIRTKGLPVPNFFLDPEDDKQFPPHIALLVMLQEGQEESEFLQNYFVRMAWLVFAFVAFVLRLVLEVIGGAGAIWGGSEVFQLRDENTRELWRWISVAVGVFCFLRFVTLNAPQEEDQGGILGPAGPWSLKTAARLRAVCEHPFHYFARGQRPYEQQQPRREKRS